MKLIDHDVGNEQPLLLIAGPCVIETPDLTLQIAAALKAITTRLGMPFVFKASFDKANRSSSRSFRGPGLEEGLRVLELVKKEVGVAVLTDVHEDTPVGEVAAVVDVLQTPAFFVRQTSFLERVAAAGKPVNVKKGQFMAPWDMPNVVEKLQRMGNQQIMLCERGVTFGYNNLVSDMRALEIMKRTGCPVIFDATHSVQEPGGNGQSSGGQREMVPVLARAAVAVGIAGVFIETHPDPDKALSDAASMWPLARVEELLQKLIAFDRVAKSP